MFKFVFRAANGYQKNLTLPFSRTVAGRMLLKKRFARTFRSPFSLAKSKFKQALSLFSEKQPQNSLAGQERKAHLLQQRREQPGQLLKELLEPGALAPFPEIDFFGLPQVCIEDIS